MAKEEQIKTSIDLTGEKEYRAACTNINSSLREINSEMKLATAEFADNASGAEALTKKQEILQKEMPVMSGKENKVLWISQEEAIQCGVLDMNFIMDNVIRANKMLGRGETIEIPLFHMMWEEGKHDG